MPPRDLSDLNGWMERWEYRLTRFFSGAFLENASVTNGMLRFIGGVLRLDSGALLDIVGKLRGVGDFLWSGKWKFDSGDGEIAGNVKLTGLLALLGDLDVTADGKITVGGIVIEPLGGGRIRVGEAIVIDSATNSIRVGSSIVIDGAAEKIDVGDDITIDGASNKISVDQMVIDPASGGQVRFPEGATVRGGSNGGVEVREGEYAAVVTSAGASVGRPGRSVSVTDAGIQVLGAPTGNPGEVYPQGVYYRNAAGFVSVASGS